MKKWIQITAISSAGILAGGGIATGIILPMALRAKDGLNNFLPSAGPAAWNSWNSNKQLDYVALGDSETAGYNAFTLGKPDPVTGKPLLDGDYLSYADFLASDLKNTGKLNEYSNFAITGARLSDQQELFGENTYLQQRLKTADLVTVTIGANDLLAFVKMLDAPFTAVENADLGSIFNGNIGALNAFRDSIFGEVNGKKTNAGVGPDYLQNEFRNSTQILKKMVDTGDYRSIITLQSDFRDAIFDVIKRNYAFFIHDLHALAPHAQIIVLGHAMPFAQWPDAVLNSPKIELDGKSIIQEYNRLVNSMRDGSKLTTGGDDAYVTFQAVDQLPIYKSSDSVDKDGITNRDKVGNTFDSYIRHTDYATDQNFYIRNAMANAIDIHPSTFGHELIGNSLFSLVGQHLKMSNQQAIDNYRFSTDVIYSDSTNNIVDKSMSNAQHWTRLDEEKPQMIDGKPDPNGKNIDIPSGRSSAEGLFDFLRSTNPTNVYAQRSSIFKQLNSPFLGQSGLSKLVDVIGSIQDWSFFTNCLYDDNAYNWSRNFLATMASTSNGSLLGGLLQYILAAENQTEANIQGGSAQATPADPSIEYIIDKIANSFSALATSIPDGDATVNKATKDEFVNLTMGVTALINTLRVSQSSNWKSNVDSAALFIEDLPKISSGMISPTEAGLFAMFLKSAKDQVSWINTANKLIWGFIYPPKTK